MQLDVALRNGFRLGDWEIRPIEGLVVGRNETRHLQPKSMDVLVCLAAAGNEVVTRDEIVEPVWGDRAVTDEPLTRCIHEIRRQLDDDWEHPTYIQTIPKRGYRLLAEVRSLSESAASERQSAESNIQSDPVSGNADSLLVQLTHQRVVWAGAGYIVLSWLVLLLADYAQSSLPLGLVASQRWPTLLIILLMVGFPFAIFFAWARQIALADAALTKTPMRMIDLLWSRRGIDLCAVTVLLSLLAGLALLKQQHEPLAGLHAESHSLAVMPFVSLEKSSEENWLGNGIAEDLLNLLTGIDGLDVAARASSFRSSLQEMDAQQIGKELDVHYVLYGQLRRDTKQLWLDVRLIDAVTGFDVWTGIYDRDVDALFAVQDEIAGQVTAALELNPAADNGAQNAVRRTDNFKAYDSYLKGRNTLQTSVSAEGLDTATAFFEQAIAHDARILGARAGLCTAHVRQIELSGSSAAFGAANTACAEAIIEAPDSAEAHHALADFYRVTGHEAEAIEEYKWVTQEKPSEVDAWIGLAMAYAEENSPANAERAFRKAMEIKPDYADTYEHYAAFLVSNGRYEDAVEVGRYLVSLDRDRLGGYDQLAAALFMSGQFDAAIQAFQEVISREPSRQSSVMNVALNYYFMRQFQDAADMYRQATRQSPGDHRAWGGLGDAYAQMQDSESEALHAYGQARELAEAQLRDAPDDFMAAIGLAHYCAGLRDRPCAEKYRAFALDRAPDDVMVNYLNALINIRLGRVKVARAFAQRALELGYPPLLFAADPLFESRWLNARASAIRQTQPSQETQL